MGTSNRADLLVLGNVITMDEHKPHAEAVAAKGDKILYVGSAEVARKLCDEHTKVLDYGANSVYPGFLEAHCHPGGAGSKMTAVATMKREYTLEECVQAMKAYMEAHPEKAVLQGFGFQERETPPCASMLDAICTDRPMIVTDSGGHSMWVNTKALEVYGIDQGAIDRWGTDCVRVDESGRPTGYLSEAPVFYIRSHTKSTLADMKAALLAWQDHALSNGYTGVYNAGVELVSEHEPTAYYELEAEGKLKLYTFSGSLIRDNTDTPVQDMDRVAKEAAEHNSKHYKIIGAKVFCDGVVEAHTAWMLDDYLDQPGYRGVSRFGEHDKIVGLVKAAQKHGMNVHIHTIGDAAVKAWVDGIAEAEEQTGDFDMRNALAHLQVVQPEEIRRMGEYNIVATCGIMWVEKEPGYYEQTVEYIGEEKAETGYPTKAFLDSGAVVVSHSDFPVSPSFSVPQTICFGAQRYLPSHGKEALKDPDQAISRMDTLRALTTNVAYMWHEEDRMGSLEVGKLANLTVFDRDFLDSELADVENAKCLATFVDGELAFEA